jgi:hypothetical protein
MQTNQLSGVNRRAPHENSLFFRIDNERPVHQQSVTRSRRGCNISAREMTAGKKGGKGQYGDK